MTINDIFDLLHKRYGYCGHCGKKKCGGKSSYSKLPDTIKLNTDWFYKELEKLDSVQQRLC